MNRWIAMLVAAVAVQVAAGAHAQTPPQDAPAGEKAAGTGAPGNTGTGAPEKKRRLKFKGDRPTCVCADPVGEAAIEAAAVQRAASEKAAAESQPRRSEK